MQLHAEAIQLAKTIRKTENKLIEVIIQIDSQKLYANFGHASLYNYITSELHFTEGRTYELINVARKAAEIPVLREALSKVEISIPKANRIVSTLNNENAEQLVTYASTHTTRETEKLLIEMNPNRKRSTQISAELHELMLQASEILNMSKEEATIRALKELIERKRKTRKPKHAHKQQPQLPEPGTRQAIPAATEREIHEKYDEQCAIKDHKGVRCPNKRYVETHHIEDVARNGTNEPENLILICAEHHDLIHQQQFPLEGAIDWRAKVKEAQIQ